VSALQALEEEINIRKGEKILIQGGAGGIGSLAIQLAKLNGAFVATTVRGEHADFVKKLGADMVIDFEKDAFEMALKNYDAVFDTVGGDITNRSLAVLKMGGILVTMAGDPFDMAVRERKVTAIVQQTITTTERLNRLSQLVSEGGIVPQVDSIFSFNKVREAFDYFEKAHPEGKIVVDLKS
jgi:NADPH:quinone reductase-like Zn-dependent oxidoreductase